MAFDVRGEVEGLGLNYDEFCDAVQEVFVALYPAWTDEEMKNHTDETLAYVHGVRVRLHCPGLPDHVVLRTLTNLRKRGSGGELE